eukprot:scaffold4248_cov231-Pinguiococcus_pyrenoidosus.AAC.5
MPRKILAAVLGELRAVEGKLPKLFRRSDVRADAALDKICEDSEWIFRSPQQQNPLACTFAPNASLRAREGKLRTLCYSQQLLWARAATTAPARTLPTTVERSRTKVTGAPAQRGDFALRASGRICREMRAKRGGKSFGSVPSLLSLCPAFQRRTTARKAAEADSSRKTVQHLCQSPPASRGLGGPHWMPRNGLRP